MKEDRVQQNQFIVILVHLRCFVVICLTSFFVFNTDLCFLVCSLSVCLSTEEVSLTVLVFLVLYIFCLFSPLKDRYAFSICLQFLGGEATRPPLGLYPWTPLGASVPDPLFCPPTLSKFLATPLHIGQERTQFVHFDGNPDHVTLRLVFGHSVNGGTRSTLRSHSPHFLPAPLHFRW